jgi:hypothetical protein
MTHEEALKAACEATILGEGENYEPVHLEMREAETAISAYLKAMGSEPVAWRARHSEQENWYFHHGHVGWWECQPLFSAPVAHPLRDEEVEREPAKERSGPEILTQGVSAVPFDRADFNLAYQKFNEVLWADINDPVSALAAAFETLLAHSDDAKLAALQPDRAGSGDAVRVKKLEDALKNLLGVYDTPLSRRRFPQDDFMREAIEEARSALTTDADRPDTGKEDNHTPVSSLVGSEADVVEAMIESLRDPFPLTMLSISGGIDRWREIMGTALRAANRYRQPSVTMSAETVLAIRDALIEESVEEAYHQLYKAVDPDFVKFRPWEEIERAALSTTATEGE